MIHDTDTCVACGGPLDTPFEKARGRHRDCETGRVDK
jgi:hypothetical protein